MPITVPGASSIASGGVNNYVMTAVDTNSIQGEAKLTFDGSTLTLDGDLDFSAANTDIAVKDASYPALSISSGGTNYMILDTRTTNGTHGIMFDVQDTSQTSASASNIHTMLISGQTWTLAGGTDVTTPVDGIGVRLVASTITSTSSTTVAQASTLYVAKPVQAGSVTITTPLAAEFDGGVMLTGGNLHLENGSLLNVGASGNDWTAQSLIIDSDYDGGNFIQIKNSSNNAGTAFLKLQVSDASGGDAFIDFQSVLERWSVGVDNSHNDYFKISNSTTLHTDTILTITNDDGSSGDLQYVGIGTNTPTAKLHVNSAFGDAVGGRQNGIYVTVDATMEAGANDGVLNAVNVIATVDGDSDENWTRSPIGISGFKSQVVTETNSSAGTITGMAGLQITDPSLHATGPTVTTQYGIHIANHTGASNNVGINLENITGSNPIGIDMGENTLENVGASGNDWDATSIRVDGTSASIVQQTTTGVSAVEDVLILRVKTNGTMADGFGPSLLFQECDASGNDTLGGLEFERAGGDTTGLFVVQVNNSGAFNEGLRLTNVGVLSVDLGGSGSAAQVDVFDDYDDPVELQRYTHMQSDRFTNSEERQISLDRMVDMGVVSEVPGASSGYHMNLQPMMNLLAGGIYQNRERMDAQHQTIDARLKRIEQALGV